MDIRPSSFVYHSNDIKKCIDFLQDINQLIMAEGRKPWLGEGMYFWDNQSNAKFWLERKKKESKSDANVCVIKGMIYTDNDLDLTDSEVADYVYNLWKKYLETIGKMNNETNTLGSILDILFEYFDLYNYYNIIKVHGKYNAPTFGIFNIENYQSQHMTLNVYIMLKKVKLL